MNTLFREGYLLAGVIMTANMFVVNEVKASDANNNDDNTNRYNIMQEGTENNEEKGKEGKIFGVQVFLDKVLSYENTINLIGGTVSSVANNYFKLWDYDAGRYFKLGCRGWRSKKFLNDILQFDINLNCVRCAIWMIATFFESYKYIKGQIAPIELTCTASVIMNSIMNNSWVLSFVGVNLFFFLSSFQGFVSVALAIHISNFSISVSLDSIIWGGIGKFLELKLEKRKEEWKKKILEEIYNQTNINSDNEENKDKKENPNNEENKNIN